MGFHINDKKDNTKGGKAAKGATQGGKTATKGKSAGGGKRIIKTGGARGSLSGYNISAKPAG